MSCLNPMNQYLYGFNTTLVVHQRRIIPLSHISNTMTRRNVLFVIFVRNQLIISIGKHLRSPDCPGGVRVLICLVRCVVFCFVLIFFIMCAKCASVSELLTTSSVFSDFC
jgi:hypothetical protein